MSPSLIPSIASISNYKPNAILQLLCDSLSVLIDIYLTVARQPIFEFLEISNFSFIHAGNKRKEGYVYIKTRSRKFSLFKCKRCCNSLKRRWLVIRDNFLGYAFDNLSANLNEIFLFKEEFMVKTTSSCMGKHRYIIKVISRHTTIEFSVTTKEKQFEWMNAINEAWETSEYRKRDIRYKSTFPVRDHNTV